MRMAENASEAAIRSEYRTDNLIRYLMFGVPLIAIGCLVLAAYLAYLGYDVTGGITEEAGSTTRNCLHVLGLDIGGYEGEVRGDLPLRVMVAALDGLSDRVLPSPNHLPHPNPETLPPSLVPRDEVRSAVEPRWLSRSTRHRSRHLDAPTPNHHRLLVIPSRSHPRGRRPRTPRGPFPQLARPRHPERPRPRRLGSLASLNPRLPPRVSPGTPKVR